MGAGTIPGSRRWRVLHVESSQAFGGSSSSLLRLLQGLDLTRFEPVVLLPAGHPAGDEFRARGVEVLDFGTAPRGRQEARPRNIAGALGSLSPGLGTGYRTARELALLLSRDVPAARRLARLMRQTAIDLVHHNDGPAVNRTSILAAGWAGIPQICHVRAFEHLSFIDRRVASKVAFFIHVSRAVERHCRTQGLPSTRGRVVYNPIDWESFEWEGDPRQVRAELGCDPSDFVLSNIGRITWWKGQDDFLLAVAEAMRRAPRVRALIVGAAEPTYRDREFAARVRRMVADLGLADKVVFTGFRRDIPALLAASDLLVHCPTQPEPLGLVVLEAMAAARPVVATATGGIPEMIDHEVTGLLTSPRDTHALAENILRLLDDPRRAAGLAHRARLHVRERFSIARHATTIQDLYSECLRSASQA